MIKRLLKDNYPKYLKTYNAFPLMIQKIDFAKYVILYHYGGIYIDGRSLFKKHILTYKEI